MKTMLILRSDAGNGIYSWIARQKYKVKKRMKDSLTMVLSICWLPLEHIQTSHQWKKKAPHLPLRYLILHLGPEIFRNHRHLERSGCVHFHILIMMHFFNSVCVEQKKKAYNTSDEESDEDLEMTQSLSPNQRTNALIALQTFL